MAGILELMGHVQQQGEQGRARGLSQLLGKAYNAPPDQRQAMLGQVANVDGGMAMDAQKAFGQQDEAIHDQIIKRAAMVSSLYKANPQMAQAAYQGLPELAQRGGFGQVPAQLDDKVAAALEQMVAAARQSGTGGNVQSTYIDDKGQRVAIMRDGSVQVLGANAPNNQIIDTGNGFFGVNKGNLQAAPVMTGGQPQQPQRAPGEVPFSIDPALPPEVQAAIRANEQQFAQAPDGGEIGIGGGGGTPQGGQLRSVPKPAAVDEESFSQPQTAVIGGKPTLVQFGNRGTVRPVQGAEPTPAATGEKPMSEYQRSQIKQKLVKAKTSIRGTTDDLTRMAAMAKQVMDAPGLDRITGLMGSLPNIPGGEAANAEAKLNSLKSQIAFAVLAKMRAMSPTGGALGSVSDAEGKRLEANLASLDKAQSYDQLRQSLQQIIDYTQTSAANLQSAYRDDFGEFEQGRSSPPQGGGGPVIRYDAQGNRIQ